MYEVRRRSFGALLLGGVTAAALAACSNSDDSAKAGAAGKSGTLLLGKLIPLQSVDPHKVNDGTSNEVLTAVYDGLYTLDAEHELVPLMAQSSKKSKDGMTYTFTIRDAQWSNGTAVTAHDFEYSWKRLVNPDTAAPNSNEAVAAGILNANEIVNDGADYKTLGVTALDDTTLQVKLIADVPYFQALLVRPAFLPLNQEYVESAGSDFGMKPEKTIYNGPFAWSSWDFAENFAAVKNKTYWNADAESLDGLTWRVVTDSQTGALLQESGELDWVEITGSLIDRYSSSGSMVTALEVHMWYFYPNFTTAALKNQDIRTALATSFDKNAVANDVLRNGSQAANYFVGKNLAVGPDDKQFRDTGGTFLEYDLTAAKAAWTKGLAALGESALTLRLLYWDDDASVGQAEYIAAEWQKQLPGLTVELTKAVKESANETAASGDFDLYLFRWGPDYKDPMAFLELLGSDSARDFGSYKNADYDAIIQKARTAQVLADQQARWDSLHEAEEILLGEVGVIPTVQNGIAMLVNPSVKSMDVRNVSLTWNYRIVTKD